MIKAEERAKEKYPTWRNGIGDEFNTNSAYYGFIEGYHQAEKDLALTVVDIKTIDRLLNKCVDCSNPYQEVLKRFKDLKEK